MKGYAYNNARKKIYIPLLLIMALLWCAKPGEPEKTLDAIKSLYAEGDYSSAAAHFTRGTRRAFEELEKYSPGTGDAGYGLAMVFHGESTWQVTGRTVRDDSAEIAVKFSSHPVENLRGNEMVFRIKREGGEWKLDMRREAEESLKSFRNDGGRIR